MTYIIPDIHGHLWEFENLLDQIGLTTDDDLILLGDYIDRGPNNKAVVDKVIELVETGYNCIPLRGNHEQMFLNSSDKLEDFAPSSNKRKRPFCNEKGFVIPTYRKFFESLGYYYETNELLLSHAGINFRKEEPFKDTHSMLWMREIRYVPNTFRKTIIHGHNPLSYDVILKNIEENKQVLPLDNGVYMKKHEGFGKLLCLQWEERKLYYANQKK